MGELARLAVTERGERRKTLCNIPSRVILSEPQVSRTFAACRKSAAGFSPMRNLGRTTLLASSSREISSGTMCPPPSLRSGSTHKTPHCGVLLAQDDTRGEQRENATVRRFLEAKSSTQGVEGEGYAPTRNDYVAGQGGYESPLRDAFFHPTS